MGSRKVKSLLLSSFILFAAWSSAVAASPSPSPGDSAKAAFVFRETSYWHRWSKNDQHEYTPKGQEDLQQWVDMITINRYPDVHDGEGLASKGERCFRELQESPGRCA